MTEGTFPEDASSEDRSRWVNELANMPVLQDAETSSIQRIMSASSFRRFEEGDLVFSADDQANSLYFLVEGFARVFQSHESVQYTPKILEPPSHFGELSVLAGFPSYRSSIAALTPMVAAEVPVTLLEELLNEDPKLCRAWLNSLARQFSVTIDFLRQNIFLGVPARLANALISYADVFGKRSEGGWITVGRDLSYANLAQQCACTRRAAIKVINAMVEQGLVRRTEDGSMLIERSRLTEELLPGRLSLNYSLDDNKPI